MSVRSELYPSSRGRLEARLGRRHAVLAACWALGALSSSRAAAQPVDDAPSPAGPFARGRADVTLRLGSASSTSSDYLIVGGAGGVYVLDGLRLGLDASIWLFGEPLVGTLTPEAKYVLHFVPVVKPYVGAFFRRYLVGGGVPDYLSAGVRMGVHLTTQGGYYGAGAVYERALDCSGSLRDCDDWYPEILVALSF